MSHQRAGWDFIPLSPSSMYFLWKLFMLGGGPIKGCCGGCGCIGATGAGAASWFKAAGSAIILGSILGSPIMLGSPAILGSILGSPIIFGSPIMLGSSIPISSSIPSSSPGPAFAASSSSGVFLLTSRLAEKGVRPLLSGIGCQGTLWKFDHKFLFRGFRFPLIRSCGCKWLYAATFLQG